MESWSPTGHDPKIGEKERDRERNRVFPFDTAYTMTSLIMSLYACMRNNPLVRTCTQAISTPRYMHSSRLVRL